MKFRFLSRSVAFCHSSSCASATSSTTSSASSSTDGECFKAWHNPQQKTNGHRVVCTRNRPAACGAGSRVRGHRLVLSLFRTTTDGVRLVPWHV